MDTKAIENYLKNQKTKVAMVAYSDLINKEMASLTKNFYFNYGHTAAREEFFMEFLPRFAEKVFERDVDLNKEIRNLIDQYKAKQLGGFNATYGRLYNWLFGFAAAILGIDELELRSRVVCN